MVKGASEVHSACNRTSDLQKKLEAERGDAA